MGNRRGTSVHSVSSADESLLGLVFRAELAELETSQHQPGTPGASARDVASCIVRFWSSVFCLLATAAAGTWVLWV